MLEDPAGTRADERAPTSTALVPGATPDGRLLARMDAQLAHAVAESAARYVRLYLRVYTLALIALIAGYPLWSYAGLPMPPYIFGVALLGIVGGVATKRALRRELRALGASPREAKELAALLWRESGHDTGERRVAHFARTLLLLRERDE